MTAPDPFADARSQWSLPRELLERGQLERLNRLLETAVAAGGLYRDKLQRDKLGGAAPRLATVAEISSLPLTTKEDIVAAAAAGATKTQSGVAKTQAGATEKSAWPPGPAAAYVRYHQTSGTRGEPLAVPDTAAGWAWWIDTWKHTLAAAGARPGDAAALAFSFGPFVGFWSAFDACVASGVRAIPAGGMSSAARAELVRRTGATLLFGTPSYALRLAEAAHEAGIDPAATAVRTVIVAGEPGGSVPATRERIAAAWGARVVDHAGATEVGPWGFGDDAWSGPAGEPPGLRVVESEFVAEFLALDSDRPATPGGLARLVLTNLGRVDTPVIRYETGDLVRPEWPSDSPSEPRGGSQAESDGSLPPCHFVRLAGGVIGRADDMVIVRGVNVFPSSLEGVLARLPQVAEWRAIATRRGEMDELRVEV
ncbi:MAG: AMP-binding protein, partial [Planctomycetota bacterium]